MEKTAHLKLREAIGAEIRRKRLAKKLTVDQLAKAAGTSRQQVWNIETGYRMPRDVTLQAVLKALGESDLDLLKEQ